jgi:hypothetical protein
MIQSRRKKPRPGRLKGAAMEKLRNDAYMRDEGRCVVCKKLVIFYAPPEHDDSMHLAHRRGKRMWGDHIDQVDTNCGECHRKFHNFGPSMTKPCPKKVRPCR